eukprot:gb/GECG01005137.1/.p1 GENE.gb/GECG01005137.1/~~gb/GECG01005137.1/.p1  ORF type:complete len:307 (+),score=25.81 gb/GECG01005137.1/:1-921(+)
MLGRYVSQAVYSGTRGVPRISRQWSIGTNGFSSMGNEMPAAAATLSTPQGQSNIWGAWGKLLTASVFGIGAGCLYNTVKCEDNVTRDMASMYHPNAICCESRATRTLFTRIRSTECDTESFVHYSDRLMNLLAEEGLSRLPAVKPQTVNTPCGTYRGYQSPQAHEIVAVSIVRAGDCLLNAVRRAVPGCSVGKILIQRDETDPEKKPVLMYVKLPDSIQNKQVLLVDPMLATGGSACKAIGELVRKGVPEENILFLNVVCCPEGLRRVAKEFPRVRVVTAAVDSGLDGQKYIVPGIGDYGDRYFGT